MLYILYVYVTFIIDILYLLSLELQLYIIIYIIVYTKYLHHVIYIIYL